MTDGYPSDDDPPRTWLDAFPWLAAAAGPTSSPWWNGVIKDAGDDTRREHLATISKLALERLARWTIGEVFPGLPPDLEISTLRLPTRASNAVAREGYRVAADLSNVPLDAMTDWRNVGVGTIDVTLQVLAEAAMQHATPVVTRSQQSLATVAQPPGASSHQIDSIIDDLSQIARWYITLGIPGRRLLEPQLPAGAPAEVVAARQRLKDLSAEDVLGEDRLATNIVKLFEDSLAKLDARAAQILGARLFADSPVTLDELGRQYNVTRERVRQVEAAARGALLGIISEDGPLASLAEAARAQIGLVLPLDELLRRIPSLGEHVKSVNQPAWRVLDRLDDAYEIENGWCVVPTSEAAQQVTSTQLQERADPYGVACLEDLTVVNIEDASHRTEVTAAWLSHCGYIVQQGFVLTRTQSVGDYACAILSLAGTPLSGQEIIDRFVYERSLGSLKNAMSIDDRIERVDRDRWALRAWGMDSYSGIRSLIREELAQNGGRVLLNDLIERITGRYSVSASSVVAYASSPPFAQRDGIVRLAGSDREIKKTPQQTRRLFRRSDAWAYRIRVSKDHLRGSGSVAPVALANILNLQFGTSVQLESVFGPQTVAWSGTQPHFGSIRRFLMESDIAAGSDAFLVIGDNGTFSFEPARQPSGNALFDALSLINAPITAELDDARRLLAVAVGSPDSAPITSVIGAYRERGDDDIADLLTSVRGDLENGHTAPKAKHHADVDEILDLL